MKDFQKQSAYLLGGARYFSKINMVNKKIDKRIVVYGGSFSPPHIGHAAAIESTLRLFPCDEIWIIPSADRRDKTMSATGDHRLKMLEILVEKSFPNSKIPIIVSDIEVKRGEMSTTIETKEMLEKQYPNYEFFFLVGTDIVGDIKDKWFRGKDLFNTANFVILKRANVQLPKDVPKKSVLFLDKQVPNVDISSTFVRRLLARGFTGMPYITRTIAEYVKEHKLYK